MRYQYNNIFSLGVIPSAAHKNKPWDLDSFLYPMVTEFQSLAEGIPDCIDGSFSRSPSRIQRNSNVPIKNQLFTLQAYITVVGADMPARDN